MTAVGALRKMRVAFEDPVRYILRLGAAELALNDWIGRDLSLRYTGTIICIACGRVTKTSFAQGYCWPCFQHSPECSPCIIRPELCRAQAGEGRDMAWEREHHLTEQIVYLADSGGIKVGVTRAANLPARWIDQGATLALRLAVAPHRQAAGLIEVALKAVIADRTNWRRMLSGTAGDADALLAARAALVGRIPAAAGGAAAGDTTICAIHYPVERYPVKVRTVGLDKQPLVAGRLAGIKGQYLIFDDGRVLNIRKHAGYEVELAGG